MLAKHEAPCYHRACSKGRLCGSFCLQTVGGRLPSLLPNPHAVLRPSMPVVIEKHHVITMFAVGEGKGEVLCPSYCLQSVACAPCPQAPPILRLFNCPNQNLSKWCLRSLQSSECCNLQYQSTSSRKFRAGVL